MTKTGGETTKSHAEMNYLQQFLLKLPPLCRSDTFVKIGSFCIIPKKTEKQEVFSTEEIHHEQYFHRHEKREEGDDYK